MISVNDFVFGMRPVNNHKKAPQKPVPQKPLKFPKKGSHKKNEKPIDK